jgi:hypothetical protein
MKKAVVAPSTHAAHGDTPMLPGYDYDVAGRGVRSDLVDAVLEALAAIRWRFGHPAIPALSGTPR